MKQNLKFLFLWTNEDHLLVISSEGAGTGGLHFCKGTVNAGKHMQVLEQHTRPSKHLVCWTEVSADLSSTEHIWWVMKQDVLQPERHIEHCTDDTVVVKDLSKSSHTLWGQTEIL